MRSPALALVAALALSALSAPGASGAAEERVDLDMMTRIRAEGFQRSQVKDILFHLTDVLGPRLTGSTAGHEASEWTRQQLAQWGLVNAHLEPFPFGRGWSFSRASVRMVAPREAQLFALPEAWTPGTEGPVHGPAIRVSITSEKDFATYQGKLAGKIVLLDNPREPREPEGNPIKRYEAEELQKLTLYEPPAPRPDFRQEAIRRVQLRKDLNAFLVKEKVLATITESPRDNGIVGVVGRGSWERDGGGNPAGVPGLVLASESYDSLVRLLGDGRPVELEVDVTARFEAEGDHSYDTLAEIPGTDRRSEVVMAGAHLDSWHGGTGATDNAAGCAVVMEAARILEALGVKPRRTIRVALWTGEEQGLLGSTFYVREHFASRPEPTDPVQKALPSFLREDTWPLQLKPEHARLDAYFNLDNGSGKIRGIYTEGNAAIRPIFAAWLEPFRDLGADTVTMRTTRGTDHVAFDRVGLPGFQFIQDALDYETRTHHSNLDVFDRARPEDLEQASVIMAAFLYDAAMRPEPLPRKPLPVAPPPKKKDEKKVEAEGKAVSEVPHS